MKWLRAALRRASCLGGRRVATLARRKPDTEASWPIATAPAVTCSRCYKARPASLVPTIAAAAAAPQAWHQTDSLYNWPQRLARCTPLGARRARRAKANNDNSIGPLVSRLMFGVPPNRRRRRRRRGCQLCPRPCDWQRPRASSTTKDNIFNFVE